MLAGGMTEQEILADYPDLQVEDIRGGIESLRLVQKSFRLGAGSQGVKDRERSR